MRISELTKKLKVSAATVSRALNPSTQHMISEKTRKRIQKFAEKHGYVPNKAARELLTGKTDTLGILLPTVFESVFFNDHLTKVLAGIYKVLEENSGYQCKLIILPRGKSLSDVQRSVLTSGVDGLLISSYCDHSIYSSHYFPENLLSNLNRPVVVLNMEIEPKSGFSSVYFSNHTASYNAVSYLIQKGHRKIAIIKGNKDFPDVGERFLGYKSALEDHHLELDSSLVMEGNFLPEGGYQATLKLFGVDGPKPTAIFCANDEMALGALDALRSLRKNCPQEVAVMGFDGIDVGNYSVPRLTTMPQPTQKITEVGTRLLLDLVNKKVKGPVAQEVPCELIIRDSV